MKLIKKLLFKCLFYDFIDPTKSWDDVDINQFELNLESGAVGALNPSGDLEDLVCLGKADEFDWLDRKYCILTYYSPFLEVNYLNRRLEFYEFYFKYFFDDTLNGYATKSILKIENYSINTNTTLSNLKEYISHPMSILQVDDYQVVDLRIGHIEH